MMMKFEPKHGRQVPAALAGVIAAAGLLFAPVALAQTQLPPPGAYTQADQRQDRIEELERQLREATAENEALQRQVFEANRETTRLRAMVGEMAAVNQSVVQQQANPQGQPMGGATTTTPPADAGSDARARATGTLGTLPADQVPAPSAQADPAAAYSNARTLLNNGNYAEAEVAFEDFLETHPRSENAAEARYWYAFTLLARNNYGAAARNFVSYITDTPRGQRGPEAQVRLGMALAGMARDGAGNDAEEMRQACGAFASLPRRYPNAPANVRALAQREARAAQCPA